ncbi:hypothetical protein L9F63_023782, partial [Diploptera punctata]
VLPNLEAIKMFSVQLSGNSHRVHHVKVSEPYVIIRIFLFVAFQYFSEIDSSICT